MKKRRVKKPFSDFWYKKYLSSRDFLIIENSFQREQQQKQETIFSLGNGFICCRGTLEETPVGCNPGTYWSGIYDQQGVQVTEIVNLPNPFKFKIKVNGLKLNVSEGYLKHQRILDLKKCALFRKTIFDIKSQRFDFQSLRFLSKSNPHLGAFQILFTPLTGDVTLEVENFIDSQVVNQNSKVCHFEVLKSISRKNYELLHIKTLEDRYSVCYAAALKIKKQNQEHLNSNKLLRFKLKKGETISFTKFFSIYTTRETAAKNLEVFAKDDLKEALNTGFEELFSRHIKFWNKIWKESDLKITGPLNIQRALRFNIYQHLIAVDERNPDIGIPAKGLTGEGYKGHIFWDAEIFNLPFFVFNAPQIAKNLLIYRYSCLKEAKKRAKDMGYQGALFGWETADSGSDCTPSGIQGEEILTGKYEQHISGDVAFGVYNYFRATGDEQFMLDYGLEIIFETARFWASRLTRGKDNFYHLSQIMGPDEFHLIVNDNTYTNYLAKWNLSIASSLYRQFLFHNQFEKVVKKIGLTKAEIEEWNKKAGNIFISKRQDSLIFDSFKNYSRKKYLPIKKRNELGLPLKPELSLKQLGKTQLIKQPDVVMLFYLFPEQFDFKTIKSNFEFYEQRTVHHSSLSAPISSLVALYSKDYSKAKYYFLLSLFCDLKDFYKNTVSGVHMASCGGVWQVIFRGFLGARFKNGSLEFCSNVPNYLKSIKMRFKFKGRNFEIKATSKKLKIKSLSKLPVKIESKKNFARISVS